MTLQKLTTIYESSMGHDSYETQADQFLSNIINHERGSYCEK